MGVENFDFIKCELDIKLRCKVISPMLHLEKEVKCFRECSSLKQIKKDSSMQTTSKEPSIDAGLPSLVAPYRHLLEVPGKGVRAKLIQAFNVWMKVEESKIKEVNEVIDILHTSSLL